MVTFAFLSLSPHRWHKNECIHFRTQCVLNTIAEIKKKTNQNIGAQWMRGQRGLCRYIQYWRFNADNQGENHYCFMRTCIFLYFNEFQNHLDARFRFDSPNFLLKKKAQSSISISQCDISLAFTIHFYLIKIYSTYENSSVSQSVQIMGYIE